MKEHVQECAVNGMPIHMTDLDHYYGRYECQCEILRACEGRVLAAAREAVAAAHRPLPVIECACGWGYDCPECGTEAIRVVGYACSQCCTVWPDTAWCDDMHNEDDTPLHHLGGDMWSGPHCPVIALIDAIRGES